MYHQINRNWVTRIGLRFCKHIGVPGFHTYYFQKQWNSRVGWTHRGRGGISHSDREAEAVIGNDRHRIEDHWSGVVFLMHTVCGHYFFLESPVSYFNAHQLIFSIQGLQ